MVTSLCVCAVDVFILITGYFSCQSDKRGIGKPLSLIFQVILCKELIYFFRAIFGNLELSVGGVIENLIPNNYFIILYVTLFIISPYINMLIRNLTASERRRMLLILLCIFSLWASLSDKTSSLASEPIWGISPIGIYGSQAGYTIINFVLVYMIGASTRLGDFKIKSRGKKYLLWYVIIVCCIALWSYWEYNRTDNNMNVSAWFYCSPLVIGEAVVIFLFFKSFSFKSNWINQLAKAALFSFLVQDFFLYNLKIGVYASKSIMVWLLHLTVSILIIYAFAFVMYKIYTFIFGRLQARLDKICIPYRN